MSYNIRPAVEADIPAIAALDFAANKHSPIAQIPFPSLSDAAALFLSRYQFFWTQPNFHFLVATIDDVIVGEAIWMLEVEGVEGWQPDLPEGTKVAFLGPFLGRIEAERLSYERKGFYELESLAVSPDHQKKGIGAALMKNFVDVLEKEKAGCYLRSTVIGKPLYVKFGWKVLFEHKEDLSEWGYAGDHWSWYMRRDPVV